MKGIKKGIIVGLLLGYMGLTSCAANRTEAKEKRSMDVQSLCKIQVEGYDGNASILAKIGYMPADEELSEEDKVSMQKLFDSITYVITEGPMSNLSNGDLVSFHTIYDEDLANYLAVVIENRDFTYEVRDLAKWELVDPFEGFCLHYYGAEPNGAYFLRRRNAASMYRKIYPLLQIGRRTDIYAMETGSLFLQSMTKKNLKKMERGLQPVPRNLLWKDCQSFLSLFRMRI